MPINQMAKLEKYIRQSIFLDLFMATEKECLSSGQTECTSLRLFYAHFFTMTWNLSTFTLSKHY